MECSRCKSEEYRKHSEYETKDAIKNRYICKKCRKTFSEHKISYTRTEKRLLSLLINFLENDLKNLDIKDFLEKSKEYRAGMSDVSIEECKKTKSLDIRSRYNIFTASCKKPRLIICEDEGKITLVKVPKKDADKHNKYFQLTLH